MTHLSLRDVWLPWGKGRQNQLCVPELFSIREGSSVLSEKGSTKNREEKSFNQVAAGTGWEHYQHSVLKTLLLTAIIITGFLLRSHCSPSVKWVPPVAVTAGRTETPRNSLFISHLSAEPCPAPAWQKPKWPREVWVGHTPGYLQSEDTKGPQAVILQHLQLSSCGVLPHWLIKCVNACKELRKVKAQLSPVQSNGSGSLILAGTLQPWRCFQLRPRK